MKHEVREAEYRHIPFDIFMRIYVELVQEGIMPPGATGVLIRKSVLYAAWYKVPIDELKAAEQIAKKALEKRTAWHAIQRDEEHYTYYLLIQVGKDDYCIQCEWSISGLSKWDFNDDVSKESEHGTVEITLKKLPSKLQQPDEAEAAQVLKCIQMAKKLRPIGMAEIEGKSVATDIDDRRI